MMDSDSDSDSGPAVFYTASDIISTLQRHDLMERLESFLPSSMTSSMTGSELLRFCMSDLRFLTEPPKRKKLPQYNTLSDAVELIAKSKNIIVLSGAGISTSAGIPDFRSRDGLYIQINAEYPDLPSPSSMFDIKYFRNNPHPFFHFAKALFPGQFVPTVSHRFVKCIEDHGKLLRNYTQNIDTLEKQAGIKRVIECHGSFDKASCTSCKYCVDGDSIKSDVMSRKVPLCPECHSSEDGPDDGLGIMKPNIVFFGEQLGSEFHRALDEDKTKVDLLIVVGSSLKVRPVALIPSAIPHEVPQILINRESLKDSVFDIELLGDSDEIVTEICSKLGSSWSKICIPESNRPTQTSETSEAVHSGSGKEDEPSSAVDEGSSSCANN